MDKSAISNFTIKLVQSKRVKDSIPFDTLEWNSNKNFLSKQSWIMPLINLPGPSLTTTNLLSFQAFFFCLPLSSYTGLHRQVFHVITWKIAPFWWMPINGLSCTCTVPYYPLLDCINCWWLKTKYKTMNHTHRNNIPVNIPYLPSLRMILAWTSEAS